MKTKKLLMTLVSFLLLTVGATAANYQLSLTDLPSGWGSSYDATTKTITYTDAWAGRGWYFGTAGNGMDMTNYSAVVVEIEPVEFNTQIVVQYNKCDADSVNSFSVVINAGESKGTFVLNEALKSDVMQVYLQSSEAGTVVLKDAYIEEIPADYELVEEELTLQNGTNLLLSQYENYADDDQIKFVLTITKGEDVNTEAGWGVGRLVPINDWNSQSDICTFACQTITEEGADNEYLFTVAQLKEAAKVDGVYHVDEYNQKGLTVVLWGGATFKRCAYMKKVAKEDGEGGSEETPAVVVKAPYEYNFKTSGLGDWTLENKVLPEGCDSIWRYDAKYGMKASAYISGVKNASESWLVSPQIDLSELTSATLTFSHAGNFFGDIKSETAVMASADGETWTQVEVSAYPSNWTFVDAKCDLSAYAGDASVWVAFKYTSTTSNAGTWEIDSISVVAEVVEPEVPAAPTYTTIAEMKDAATADEVDVVFTFDELLVTGVSGKNAFVTDGTNGFLLYGTAPTFKKGDKIAGKITGQLYLYNGLTEMTGVNYESVTVTSSDNEVVAKTLTFADINNNEGYKTYESMYVKFENVTFTSAELSSKNVTMTDDDDNTLTLRDNFNIWADLSIDITKPYNVCAYVVNYKGTPQVYPMEASDIQIITSLVAPTTAWAKDTVLVKGLTATVENSFSTDSDGAATFTSSNEKVATVSAEGVVTVTGYGLATITIETAETAEHLVSKASFILMVASEGDGALATPYVASDANIYVGQVTDYVWVKGYIVGYVNGSNFTFELPDPTGAVETEFLIANTPDETNPEACIPVQLPKGAIREALTLSLNQDNYKKEVWLYGKFDTYFSVPGLKNLKDYSFDGTTVGLEQIEQEIARPAVIYNILGQRVANMDRPGIYVVNGKKILVK